MSKTQTNKDFCKKRQQGVIIDIVIHDQTIKMEEMSDDCLY